jgi:N-methylhydantoinase A/oxoprolinase/acetone carboxylase beta subunit
LAREHADRLLAAPQDPSLGGYPDAVVTKASAAVALESGHKPVVLLFYDDTARASNLQAAEFLPVLAKHADRVDVVAIDLSAAARWTAEERKLVKSYYGAYVPTTVVLSADRKPRLLKYQRITAAVLEAALDRELPR